jgi:hypothetical protein
MEYEKIDACKDNDMFFYKEHKNETNCLKRGKLRFVEVVKKDGEKVKMKVAHKQLHYIPLTPRMIWLFLSKKIARHMRWQKEGVRENDQVMVHPSDSEAWKALDDFNVDITRDARIDSRPIIRVRHRTLVGPFLLFRTTFHLSLHEI